MNPKRKVKRVLFAKSMLSGENSQEKKVRN